MNQDESQLRLLAVLHYVLAGLCAVFSSFFLFHVFMGVSMWRGSSFFPPSPGGSPPPASVGIMFALMGGAAVLGGWLFTACLIFAGRSLATKKRYTFCLVVAGLACLLCNPIGVGLGVFTFIVLFRPTVKHLFGVTS